MLLLFLGGGEGGQVLEIARLVYEIDKTLDSLFIAIRTETVNMSRGVLATKINDFFIKLILEINKNYQQENSPLI